MIPGAFFFAFSSPTGVAWPKVLGHVTIRLATFGEQFFNSLGHNLLPTGPIPVELTVPPVPYAAFLIDQVDAGPHRIAPRIPVLLLVVDDHGEIKVCLLHFLTDTVNLSLSGCLRGMNANNQ